MTKEEFLSEILMDVSKLYELVEEFIEDREFAAYARGIDEVTHDPESYGLTHL